VNDRDRRLDEATCYKLVGHMIDRRIKAVRYAAILMDQGPCVYRVIDLLAIERLATNAIHRAMRKC
jgi:hypothetical protein